MDTTQEACTKDTRKCSIGNPCLLHKAMVWEASYDNERREHLATRAERDRLAYELQELRRKEHGL